MKNALVTGGEGFVGRHLSKALRERGYSVSSIDLKNGLDCLRLFRGDRRLGWDLVCHCAAQVGGREGIDFNAAQLGAYNCMLDGAMFDWALTSRPGRILYLSSAAAYPVWRQNTVGYLSRESDAGPGWLGIPDESYGWIKVTGEMLAQKVRAAGVPVTVVRPFSMYDFDQDDDYPFPQFAKRAARKDDPFIVWGDGQQVRDWIHIDDATKAMLALLEYEVDGPINLGTGIGTSMDQLAKLAQLGAGYDARIEHLVDKPIGVRYRVADVSLLKEYYKPRITVGDGMFRAVAAHGG
jgi:nucleoside-diphosphate-sugar epimerase